MSKICKSKSLWLKLELSGILFSFISATLLHFSYEWSAGSIWSILFAAANESIWEHIKILTLPYLFWTLIELSIMRIPIKGIIVAKTAGVYSISLLTILFFKAYTSILGYSIPFVDILSAFLWIIVGFFISYKLICLHTNFNKWFAAAIFSLILFLVMFMTFTINPPQCDIFIDPITGNYGIPSNNWDAGAVYLDTLVHI